MPQQTPLWVKMIFFHIVWLVVVPLLYGGWLQHELDLEFAAGREDTSDSIAIPIYQLFVVNFFSIVLFDFFFTVYLIIKKRLLKKRIAWKRFLH